MNALLSGFVTLFTISSDIHFDLQVVNCIILSLQKSLIQMVISSIFVEQMQLHV